MESHVRIEVLIIFYMGTLLQASISSSVHCPVRAKPQEDMKSIQDAYDEWAQKTFISPGKDKGLIKPCGVSAVEMEAKESSLETVAIGGGEKTPPEKWPWQVLVYSTLDNRTCGGTLISDMWVVTAAQCVVYHHPKNRVWAGIHNRLEIDRGQRRVISRTISYEYFNRANLERDMALLKLSEPLYLNDTTWPACLPSQSETFGQGEECYTTGYGAAGSYPGSNVLNELEVSILDRSKCKEIYDSSFRINLDESMFCSELGGTASTRNDGTCAGDPGGPLVCRRNHQWTLVGILSSGMGCVDITMPDLLTNVSHFRDWIDDSMLVN